MVLGKHAAFCEFRGPQQVTKQHLCLMTIMLRNKLHWSIAYDPHKVSF